jgi:hypothetical protein
MDEDYVRSFLDRHRFHVCMMLVGTRRFLVGVFVAWQAAQFPEVKFLR